MKMADLMTQSINNDSKNAVSMVNGRVYIGDRLLPTLPKKRNYQRVSQRNNRLFVNGYEWDFEKEYWKRTLKSFLINIF